VDESECALKGAKVRVFPRWQPAPKSTGAAIERRGPALTKLDELVRALTIRAQR
jgi:hypothetical protein